MTKRGMQVQPFKKGPDYIDPMWLGRAAGGTCYNLDFFTQSHEEIHATFATQSSGADISLIEGNKGLFDGLDVEGTDSNAALATMLSTPVVLVIDTSGMTRGIAPLISGYLNFDQSVEIRGVILNKVGGSRHEGKLRAALERYTDTEVLGAIGRDKTLEIPERHLGLVPANETGKANSIIERLSATVTGSVDIDQLIAIAGTAPMRDSQEKTDIDGSPEPDVRIAIARDAAFGFYYPDDLSAFASAGAELVPFDALNDSRLPEADGLFIGGGFPETHLESLAGNQCLLSDIKRKLAAGLPAYAECGGMMYLAQSIQWRDEKYAMAGVVPGDIFVAERPQGRGYVRLEETGKSLWPIRPPSEQNSGSDVPAHEFHYARLENVPNRHDFVFQVHRGHGIDGHHDGLIVGNLIAGFAHHRNTEADPWVERFVAFVRKTSQNTSSGDRP